MQVPVDIPSFISGVSRQPFQQRLASQVQEADNVTLSLVRGAERRTGTRPVFTGETDKALAHTITAGDHVMRFVRDGTRLAFVVLSPLAASPADCVKAYNALDGTSMPITYDTTYGDPKAYIQAGTGDLRFCLSGDTFVVTNRGVVTAMTGASTSYLHGGTSVDGTANAHFKASYTDFDFPPAANGDYWFSQKDAVGRPAGYYISQNIGTSLPKYARVRSPEANFKPDPTKMPIKVMFNGTGFTVSCIDWAPRYSGDSVTNPQPDFIGSAINAVTFHSDRLWFGYNNKVWGGPVGDYWNVWLDNWQAVGDSDFVQGTIPSDGVSFVVDMASFENGLVVFGTSNQQFLVTTSDGSPIAPGTFAIIPSTREAHTSVPPVYYGKRLYWVSSGDSKMFEYQYTGNGVSNVAIDCSSHVSGYLPVSPSMLSVAARKGMLFLSSLSDPYDLLVYTNTWMGDEKVQSAWHKFRFADVIRAHMVYEDTLYILFKRNNRYYIEFMEVVRPDTVVDDLVPIHLHMDCATPLYGSYNAGTNRTTWTLPFADSDWDTIVLSTESGSRAGFALDVDKVPSFATLSAEGDWASELVYVGRSFPSTIELSPPVVKNNEGTVQFGITRSTTLSLRYKDTGTFNVTITPERREPIVKTFTAVNTGIVVLGALTLATSGEFVTHPMIKADDKNVITITSSSHLPLRLTGGAFIVQFTPSRRSV
jgi:hypothetical protein